MVGRGQRSGGRLVMAMAAMAMLLCGMHELTAAVDRSNFKTCEQSAFCKRQTTDRPADWTSPYSVERESIHIIQEDGQRQIAFELRDSRVDSLLKARISGFEDKTIRLYIDEKQPMRPRYRVQDVVLPNLKAVPVIESASSSDDVFVATTEDDVSIIITYAPFRVDFLRDKAVVATFNGRGLLDFEQYRERRDDDPEGMWEESFKSHKDSKPHGPSAVSVDMTFHESKHVYGIPEHADSFALRQTQGGEPYRLYNLDVFEYELDETMALYGSIPYMVSHSAVQTSGMLFLNAAEMWVHIGKASSTSAPQRLLRALRSLLSSEPREAERPTTETQWIAESGVVDVFVFLGPCPKDVFRQYGQVTGTAELPPLFSIAYHQCRWNYNDQDDVMMVDRRLDEADIAADVMWLDIEHTDGKRYMTWDRTKFPEPEKMQKALNTKGRKMVNIVDPHIKRASGYRIHEEAEANGLYVHNKDDKNYDGWCWPGSSSWIDFMNPDIRSWWADQFALDKYEGTTHSMYFWNDMNEPSVFNGPEVTMHKDAKHFGGWEHRDVHNIYGMWQQASTAEGIRRRSGGTERPFVLSRAFFAGSQRYGAMWTGDNMAEWEHMEASVPMLLSASVAGLPFSGADIGGFFGNPESELLVRWYQVGAYQPFMRAHAHLDTKRREPYLLGPSDQAIVRSAIRARYELLPYWYTLFHHSARTGIPVMRPLWAEYPDDEACFTEQSTYLVGSDLLVAPVTTSRQTSVSVYFPGTQPWYDVETAQVHRGLLHKNVAAPMRKIPVFQRGGSIVPRKLRVRRTSGLTHHDPFTLVAALDEHGTAEGSLYADDYHSYNYRKGDFVLRQFSITQGEGTFAFTSTAHPNSGQRQTPEWIERLRIHGVETKPASVVRREGVQSDPVGGASLAFTYNAQTKTLEIKKPSTESLSQDFTVLITQ